MLIRTSFHWQDPTAAARPQGYFCPFLYPQVDIYSFRIIRNMFLWTDFWFVFGLLQLKEQDLGE